MVSAPRFSQKPAHRGAQLAGRVCTSFPPLGRSFFSSAGGQTAEGRPPEAARGGAPFSLGEAAAPARGPS